MFWKEQKNQKQESTGFRERSGAKRNILSVVHNICLTNGTAIWLPSLLIHSQVFSTFSKNIKKVCMVNIFCCINDFLFPDFMSNCYLIQVLYGRVYGTPCKPCWLLIRQVYREIDEFNMLWQLKCISYDFWNRKCKFYYYKHE